MTHYPKYLKTDENITILYHDLTTVNIYNIYKYRRRLWAIERYRKWHDNPGRQRHDDVQIDSQIYL